MAKNKCVCWGGMQGNDQCVCGAGGTQEKPMYVSWERDIRERCMGCIQMVFVCWRWDLSGETPERVSFAQWKSERRINQEVSIKTFAIICRCHIKLVACDLTPVILVQLHLMSNTG